ncbi:MAG: hypothetical protein M3P83_13650 [Actinomycetota bacterium]|nr:hypothetical protein [Actinomycetota bacterium]
MHCGVYAVFTGPLPWPTRCWAALLYCGDGAALAGETALAWWQPRPTGSWPQVTDGPVVVAIDQRRRVEEPDGIRVWRLTALDDQVHPLRVPRRLRVETAALLSASRVRQPHDAIGVIADVCQQGLTTPHRLLLTLRALPDNTRLRAELREVLGDVAAGAYSYLEVQYLRRVERPHGLPTGVRQRVVRRGRQVWFRDVEYVGYAVLAELDGRLGHETFLDRSRDVDRDNAATRAGAQTYRIGYRQVLGDACATAQLMADALRGSGWRGRPRRCGRRCPVR